MTASIRFDPIAEFNAAIRLARAGNTLAGLKQARAAYKVVREGGDPALLRKALNTVAICQAAHGQFIEAVADAIDAYRLSQQAGDALEATHALATLAGASAFILDTLDPAMLMLDKCLERALAIGDVPLEVRVRNVRGILLGSLQRFAEAEQEFAVAISLVDRAGDITRPAMLAGNVAAMSAKQSRHAPPGTQSELWAIALSRANEAIDIALLEANTDVESRGYYNLADIRQQQGDIPAAMAAFDRSMQLARKIGQRDRVINCQVERGNLFAGQGQWQAALDEFESALVEAESNRPTIQIAVAAEQIANAFEQLGDAGQAGKWRQRVGEERAVYERESLHARRQLEAFWRDINGTPAP